jgi:hypothetical protein
MQLHLLVIRRHSLSHGGVLRLSQSCGEESVLSPR